MFVSGMCLARFRCVCEFVSVKFVCFLCLAASISLAISNSSRCAL